MSYEIEDVRILAGVFVASGWLKKRGWPTLAEQMEKEIVDSSSRAKPSKYTVQTQQRCWAFAPFGSSEKHRCIRNRDHKIPMHRSRLGEEWAASRGRKK